MKNKCLGVWCKSVLPSIYAESLSYYEAICKLAERIDNILEEMDDRYVNVNGDTMQGNLNMGNYVLSGLRTPVNPSDAATKGYVDASQGGGVTPEQLISAISEYAVRRDGSNVPQADLPMGGYGFTDVKVPTNDGDVVTKEYVDDNFTNNTDLDKNFAKKDYVNNNFTNNTVLARDYATKEYVDTHGGGATDISDITSVNGTTDTYNVEWALEYVDRFVIQFTSFNLNEINITITGKTLPSSITGYICGYEDGGTPMLAAFDPAYSGAAGTYTVVIFKNTVS